MEPRITYAIGQGFRAANRSWAGIGLFAVGLTAVMLLAVLCLAISNPPPEVFEEPAPPARLSPEPGRAAVETGGPGPSPVETVAPVPASVPDVAPAAGLDAGDEWDDRGEPPTLFDQLDTLEPPPAPEAPSEAASAVEQQQVAQLEERERIAQEWFGQAWPLLLLALLIVMAGNVWLSGGQIGYVVSQVTAQRKAMSEFWASARRSFLPLLGAATIILAALGALAVVLALLSILLDAMPDGPRTVLGILLAFALTAGMLWLVIRISFWFIAIVADQKELVAGLRTSLRLTRGRWLRVAGLAGLLALISYGAGLPGDVLVWLGGAIGGGIEPWLGALGGVLKAVVGLYVGFAALGAYVRFYEDAKAATASVGAPGR